MDFGPEGLTVVEKGEWEFTPKMIDVIGDIRISKEELELSAEQIKRWFHTDKFLKFNDLTTTLREQPSATQIIKMAAEIAVQLVTGVSTFTSGPLTSIDNVAISIEARAGRGPFNPERMAEIQDIVLSNSVTQISSIDTAPIFIGPLARAQKIKQELDPILDGLGALAPLFVEFPDLKFAIREYGTAEDILKAVNFPLKNLRPEDEYDEIVAQLNEARARVEQQTQALEMAKVAPNISGPVDESSILAGAAG